MHIKILLSNSINHFKTILIHKFWVAYYCFKAGIPWQGIMHDISKFSHIEFFESMKYYKGTSSPIPEAKKDKGYSLAWQHHKGRNPHHHEYWTDNYDNGTTCIVMPYKYAVEMICDYLGAARAYLGKNFSYNAEYEWWLNKKSSCKMHPLTKIFVTIILRDIALRPDLFNKSHFKYIFDTQVMSKIYETKIINQ